MALISYKFGTAILPTSRSEVPVVFSLADGLHVAATDWLGFMTAIRKSPNTVKSYGQKIAAFLTWCNRTGLSWRTATLTDISAWKNEVATTPYIRNSGPKFRTPGTVDVSMTALVEFYKWAASVGLVSQETRGELVVKKYVPPGPGNRTGGGLLKEVKVRALRSEAYSPVPPKWVELESARRAILRLPLSPRDRFIVDLLYTTGIRAGEMLSLFRSDLHLLADNQDYGCPIRGPHVHVTKNETQNGARAKTGPRWVPTSAYAAQSYSDYLHKRFEYLGADDNPHALVNFNSGYSGSAMTYDGLTGLFKKMSRLLGFYLRPHMLRHTRATLWVRGIEGPKIDLDVVQALLGHADIASTQVYLHATNSDLRKAAANSAIIGLERESTRHE